MAKRKRDRDRGALEQHVPDAQAALHYLKTGKIEEFKRYCGLSEDRINEALQHYNYRPSDDDSNTSQ